MNGHEIGRRRSRGWRLAGCGLALASLIGCANGSGTGAAETVDEPRIISEIEALVDAFHAADTAMNAEGVIDLLWPDYYMLADGTRIEYDDVVAGSREFMAGLDLFHTEWTDLRITPLGPNAAVSSFQFRDSIITKTGELIRARGPTTFVWQKRNGEWRIVFADADHYPITP